MGTINADIKALKTQYNTSSVFFFWPLETLKYLCSAHAPFFFSSPEPPGSQGEIIGWP